MKYTTKQLLEMSYDELEKICNLKCETKYCPFKPSLRELSEYGFCIKRTYEKINDWIYEDESHIKSLEIYIKYLKELIETYRNWKKKIEKELV